MFPPDTESELMRIILTWYRRVDKPKMRGRYHRTRESSNLAREILDFLAKLIPPTPAPSPAAPKAKPKPEKSIIEKLLELESEAKEEAEEEEEEYDGGVEDDTDRDPEVDTSRMTRRAGTALAGAVIPMESLSKMEPKQNEICACPKCVSKL